MNLQEEIAKVAHELYEKSGRIEGRDRENWLEAERIVLARHSGQDMEEPEGEEPIISEETVTEEIERTELRQISQENEEGTTVMEEVEVGRTPIEAEGIKIAKGRTMPAKKTAPKKKTTEQKKKV
jgi:hypothetical protein